MCPYASALWYPLGKFLAVLLLGHRVGLFLIFFHLFIFERQKETEHKWGGAEREGNKEFQAVSRLRTVSREPDTGLELMNCEITT